MLDRGLRRLDKYRECVELLESGLKKSPLYGHRLATRARNLLIESILEEAEKQEALERAVELDEMMKDV